MNEQPTFHQIAENYTPLIKSTIQQLHIYKDHEDMAQIGMIALWDAYRNYDPDKGPFGAYAKTMVRGRMLRALAQDNKYIARNMPVSIGKESGDVLSAIPDAATRVPLEDAMLAPLINGLSERERLWVQEVVLAGKKTRELAEAEHVSTNTVRTWKKAAVKKMKANARKL